MGCAEAIVLFLASPSCLPEPDPTLKSPHLIYYLPDGVRATHPLPEKIHPKPETFTGVPVENLSTQHLFQSQSDGLFGEVDGVVIRFDPRLQLPGCRKRPGVGKPFCKNGRHYFLVVRKSIPCIDHLGQWIVDDVADNMAQVRQNDPVAPVLVHIVHRVLADHLSIEWLTGSQTIDSLDHSTSVYHSRIHRLGDEPESVLLRKKSHLAEQGPPQQFAPVFPVPILQPARACKNEREPVFVVHQSREKRK